MLKFLLCHFSFLPGQQQVNSSWWRNKTSRLHNGHALCFLLPAWNAVRAEREREQERQ